MDRAARNGRPGSNIPGLGRPGGDLLFHALRRSTIGAEGFHGRVRDGIGCGPLAMTTRPAKTGSCPAPTIAPRDVSLGGGLKGWASGAPAAHAR